MPDIAAYREFIAGKGLRTATTGFAARNIPSRVFEHQRRAVEFACEKGKAAIFLGTGMGKSGCEAIFASETARETGRPALILTPLAVARQMKRECEAFDVEASVIREASEVTGGINIANYERLPKLDIAAFGSVILDESSILKNFVGKTKVALVTGFANTPYRLAATATPAPNDHIELGTHSEFLGGLNTMEMLARWFINDTSTASQEWRLKGHAQTDFWAWVASWARAASMPSDMGGDDAAFTLPPLNINVHTCRTDIMAGDFDGLFRTPSGSATDIHREKLLTINERIGRAAEIANGCGGYCIVWCERDDESAMLTKAIPDAIEVIGSMPFDAKEDALDRFARGDVRVLVTKPKIGGFGLNLQHVDTQVFASLTHSYERYYQAIRRSWRFGQRVPVTVHVIIADTEQGIWQTIRRKADDHERMKDAMAAAMRQAQAPAATRRAYGQPMAIELPSWLGRTA